MRRITFWILAISAVLTAPSPVLACTCVTPPPPAEAMEGADAVFAGEIVRIDTLRSDDGYLLALRATFEVEQVWKGVSGSTIEVETNISGASCGLGFEKDQQWLIYALQAEDGRFGSSLCDRSTELEGARESGELAALGEPISGTSNESDDGGSCGGPLGASLQILLFVGLGGLMLRRKTRDREDT